MNKSLIHVKIDPALKSEALQLADRLDVPLSVVINAVLRKFIAEGGLEIREYGPGAADLIVPYPDHFKVPSVDEYTRAIKKLYDRGVLKPWATELLSTHYKAPDRMIFSSDLAKKLGWKSYRGVNRWYAYLGEIIGKEMNVSNDDIYAIVLSSYRQEPVPGKEKPEWRLTMREEVAQALEKLKIV